MGVCVERYVFVKVKLKEDVGQVMQMQKKLHKTNSKLLFKNTINTIL